MSPRKPFFTLLTFAIACAVPYFVPALERFRLLRPAAVATIVKETPITRKSVPAAIPKTKKKEDDSGSIDIPEPAHVSIEDPAALAYFYAALENTRGGRHVTDPHGLTR